VSLAGASAIADAILYEGYMLYPYRRSALKNRGGWTFGVIPPRAPGRRSSQLRFECLVVDTPSTGVTATLRFLLPLSAAPDAEQAIPCEVTLRPTGLEQLRRHAVITPFAFGSEDDRVDGHLELSAHDAAARVSRLMVTVTNTSQAPARDDRAQRRSMVSTHVILGLHDGEFVPLRDAPPSLAAASEACRQEGLWPILVGERGRRDVMIGSPIILEDYPRIAPESPSSLFDGAEIDEILTLRILTLAQNERDEIAAGDPRVRALLARTDALGPTEIAQLHGTMRPTERAGEPPRTLSVHGRDLGAGDRVRLRPTRRSDVMDIVLSGQLATIVSVEQDLDDRSYFAVTVDDDPGQDLGALGKPGHRFFFGPDEVEPVPA
jgi:hypothetical protein